MKPFTVRPKRFWRLHKLFKTKTWKQCLITEEILAIQYEKISRRIHEALINQVLYGTPAGFEEGETFH